MFSNAPRIKGNTLSYGGRSYTMGAVQRVEVVRSEKAEPPFSLQSTQSLITLLVPLAALAYMGLYEQDWRKAGFMSVLWFIMGLARYYDGREQYDVLISHGADDFAALGPMPGSTANRLAQKLEQLRN